MTLDTSARLQIICFEFLLFMVLFKAFACKYKFAFKLLRDVGKF